MGCKEVRNSPPAKRTSLSIFFRVKRSMARCIGNFRSWPKADTPRGGCALHPVRFIAQLYVRQSFLLCWDTCLSSSLARGATHVLFSRQATCQPKRLEHDRC